MKVVSQVQDKDPELFNKLCNAWDPLWAALQDESNLKKVSQVRAMETGATVAITDVFMSVINTVIPLANAEEILSHDDTVKKDLLVVVAAQGVVCTAITVYKKITNHDYVATCEGGDKYRVNVSDDGRVNVAPHPSPK